MKMRRLKIMWVLMVTLTLMIVKISSVDIENDDDSGESKLVWNTTDVEFNIKEVQHELDSLKKEEALVKLKKILGIHGITKEDNRIEHPPQFMVELYNTVTDQHGKTRRNNPYNAKIVRSFIEKDSSTRHIYLFNISGLEDNESVLEAELHLFRKRSSPESMHPSVLSSPYYIMRVYQILPEKNLEEHDLHRLLNVHYVGAYASGWQIFNVKQAVLSWLSGSPNLGLLVTATTIFGDPVTVDFSRRNDQPTNKQPILVLFNENNKDDLHTIEEYIHEIEHDDELDDDLEINEESIENEMIRDERIRNKRHENLEGSDEGQIENVPEYIQNNRPVYFRREKGRREKPRDENDIIIPRRIEGFVSRRKSFDETLTSMDIYQRAMLREKLNARRNTKNLLRHRHEHNSTSRIRRDVVGSSSTECRKIETEPCAKRELFVNFREIGLTEIIAPESYAAYQCRGHCKSPLSQDQKPTNHATIQGIMNKMDVTPMQDVEMPCCVPVNLSSISILYHDDNKDGVVLKSYEDMVVKSCGCR